MSETRTLADLKELVAGTPAAPEAAGGNLIASSSSTSGFAGTWIGPRVGRSRSQVTNSRKATRPAAMKTANPRVAATGKGWRPMNRCNR